jgi:hypothetical protein
MLVSTGRAGCVGELPFAAEVAARSHSMRTLTACLLVCSPVLAAALTACTEGKMPVVQVDAGPRTPLVPAYVAEMRKSAALCKQMQADITAVYEKPQKLVVRVQNSKEFNFKYLKKDATHLAFEVECGTVTFNAYGPQDKFQPLREHIDANPPPPRTVEITVMTDKSHGNPGIFTLLEWRKLD